MKQKTKSDRGSIISTNSLLQDLVALPRACVYALVDEVGQRIQVFSTLCMTKHLGTMLDEISVSGEYKSLWQDIQKLKLIVLETIDPKNRKVRHGYWVSYYRSLGWSFYKDNAPVTYSLETKVGFRFGTLSYFVWLRNKRKDKILVGIFTRKKEMKTWIDTYYPDGIVRDVVRHESVREPT
jgi:hypothetical protein